MDTTIFGEHEQRVIDQLDRCVAREEGSRGVLCADGQALSAEDRIRRARAKVAERRAV